MSTMNQKFLENLAKPCQTAGWPVARASSPAASASGPTFPPAAMLQLAVPGISGGQSGPPLRFTTHEKQRNKPNLPELTWNHRFQSRPQPLAHPANLEKRSEPNSRLRFNRSTVQRRYPERTQFRPSYLESMAWHRCLLATLGSRACRTLPLVRPARKGRQSRPASRPTVYGPRFTIHGSRFTGHG